MRKAGFGLLLLGFLALSTQSPLGATSYLSVADPDLADQAVAVVVVEVRASGPAPGTGEPATVYQVAVERVLKGHLPGGSLAVRVPGGVRADGIGLRIWGAPRFAAGERALLFLASRPDGSWEILHLMLGAFHEVTAGGRRFAVRDLSEAQALSLGGKAPGSLTVETTRDFDRFADWVAARALGLSADEDYLVPGPPPPLEGPAESFTLLTDPATSLPLRWFEFATGGSIGWRAHVTGQVGLTGGGYSEFQTAIAAWNADPDTAVAYTYDGTTSATGGLQSYDGVNEILFNDPNNEIGTFSCASGGVLAQGGPWYDSTATASFQGRTYIRSVGADVVVNNGLSCFFAGSVNPSQAAAELFAHELGHTLGLGHSCESVGGCSPELQDALMYAFIHNDGRGAQLKSDDRAGLFMLYNTVPYHPGAFFSVPPCRLLDTRDPSSGGPLVSGEVRIVQVSGLCGLPTLAKAVSLNVTAVDPSGAGHLTLHPADEATPGTARSTSALTRPGPTTPSSSCRKAPSGHSAPRPSSRAPARSTWWSTSTGIFSRRARAPRDSSRRGWRRPRRCSRGIP